MTLDTDLCIIGAGPAGATASLFLAQRGIDHVLLDAETFPRDKICGDGLDLKVVRVLRHLDPALVERELPAQAAFLPSWGARFTAPSGRATDFCYQPRPGGPSRPILWTARRADFDRFLVERLDGGHTDFRPGTRVVELRRDGKNWRVFADGPQGPLEIRTPMVAGADGDHSIVLRSLGERKIDRRHYAGTLRQYWRGVAGLHPQNLIEVYFPPGLPMSYFYVFPLSGGVCNVGYGMVSEIAAKGRHNLRAVFRRLLEADRHIAPRFAAAEPLETPVGWGLPLASRRRRPYGDGYLLLGDAASLVCPTSGEGIGTAMFSGFIAARFLERALARRRYDAGQFVRYEREIHRRLTGESRLYRLLLRMRPWSLYDRALNLALPHPWLETSFQRQAAGWLRTAYEKEIEVVLD